MKRFFLFSAIVLVAVSCSKSDIFGTLIPDDGLFMEPTGEGGDKFEDFEDNPFISTAEQPVSTFSVDADGASYAIVRRYLTDGYDVPKSAVRIEEFLNYFTFDYESPEGPESVAINAEVADCPWAAGHKLMRLGIKGRDFAQGESPKSNYVFLVDVSGSMNSSDKLELLKSGLIELVDQLDPEDRISIITYSGEVRKWLESTLVRDSETIKKAIRTLVASGSTNGGQAIKIAYEEALDNYIEGGNNRVIMGTDGDFNVGVVSTDELVELVEDYATKGIYLTACGFGSGNLNDAMMEKISNCGNGTYSYIDCEDELTKVFVNERNNLISVASDSKIQITFNGDVVDSYRLIGYENRVLSNEDFENDNKDAGEVGAGQTITALYEIIPVQEGVRSDVKYADFDFRYKKALGQESRPLSLEVRENGNVSENFRFAAGVAEFGMIMRQSPYKGESSYESAASLIESSLTFDPFGYRLGLLKLINSLEAQEQ